MSYIIIYEKPDYKAHKSLILEKSNSHWLMRMLLTRIILFFHQKVVITGVFTAFPDREKLGFQTS